MRRRRTGLDKVGAALFLDLPDVAYTAFFPGKNAVFDQGRFLT
jgi:hypothetical protein